MRMLILQTEMDSTDTNRWSQMKATRMRVCMKLNTLILSFASLILSNLERGQRSRAQLGKLRQEDCLGSSNTSREQGRNESKWVSRMAQWRTFTWVQGLLYVSVLQFSKHQHDRTELEKTPLLDLEHKPCAVGRRPSLCPQSISRNPWSLTDKSGWCSMFPGDYRCAPAGSTP